MADADKTLIRVTDLRKTFPVGAGEVEVLKGINLTIEKGEFVIIFGPSGCGKSTLLHTLLGLEPPSSGTVLMEGADFYTKTGDERATYRRHRVGIIYQQPLWIHSLNVIENVVFSLHLLDYSPEIIDGKANEALKAVGMDSWASYKPTELSSGQQQKISLARAMVLDPVLLVADEPTGNLDTVSGQELVDTFLSFRDRGITIIMVTHDLEYLKYGTHIIHMLDGQVVEEVRSDGKAKNRVRDIHGKRGGDNEFETANVRDPHFLDHAGKKKGATA